MWKFPFFRRKRSSDKHSFGVAYVLDANTTNTFEEMTMLSMQTVAPHCSHVLYREPVHPTLHRYMIKLPALKKSPFSITLLLDGDTLVLDPSILSYAHWDALLGDADYGIVVYNEQNLGKERAIHIREEFPHIAHMDKYANAGVLVVRKEGVDRLCDVWLETYNALCATHNRMRMFDEPALNVALQTTLADKTVWLPKPYNIRRVSETTKIAHFFGLDIAKKLEAMREVLKERNMLV